jgi:hypothetical protein
MRGIASLPLDAETSIRTVKRSTLACQKFAVHHAHKRSEKAVDRNACKTFRDNQEVKGALCAPLRGLALDFLIVSEKRVGVAIDGTESNTFTSFADVRGSVVEAKIAN